MTIRQATTVDRRIQRTERALAGALIQLTLERPYDEISVRDIAAKAGVGYATFFRRHPDKDSLLLTALDLVTEELIATLIPLSVSEQAAALGTRLFQYAAEHAKICLVLLRVRHVPAIRDRLIQIGAGSALETGIVSHGTIPPEIGVIHLLQASMSLLEWWLEHDMPYSTDQMGAIYAALVLKPLANQ